MIRLPFLAIVHSSCGLSCGNSSYTWAQGLPCRNPYDGLSRRSIISRLAFTLTLARIGNTMSAFVQPMARCSLSRQHNRTQIRTAHRHPRMYGGTYLRVAKSS
uniref:Putative secreted protein n=1 Tax=Anopheles darlingi TaxID=43151 RepID=A0A2M4DII6_ANODA